MRLAVEQFRGETPATASHLLGENGAQEATNCRLQTGDLESWRQFLLTKTLANAGPTQTIYLLNGAWLSWPEQVDVARGVIPGDDTFRTYLTCPGLYATPRFTNYAMATTGVEPYPVHTRPLGVPGPSEDMVPTFTIGVDPTPLTFSVDVVDTGESLATEWTVSSGQLNTADNSSEVIQHAVGNPGPGYRLDAQNNVGNPAYAIRKFGIGNTLLATLQADVMIEDAGGNDHAEATFLFGCDTSGDGARISVGGYMGSSLALSIGNAAHFSDGSGTVAHVACTGSLVLGAWYTVKATKTVKADGTATIVATLLSGTTELGTVTTTNSFPNYDYCGFVTAKGDDRLVLHFDNFHVQGNGSTNYVATKVGTSYVYTFKNDLFEESPPSLPSATVLRPDGISVTVTTPTTVPAGTDPAYGITTKCIYRSVTGSTGTIFVLVDEIPLLTPDYVDTKGDEDIADSTPLATDLWDLPPDDLQGIIALPNGIMAGFRRNQVCLSAAGYPHAWPVPYRLTADTDIVAIANIDNTLVIGTKSFLYTATGNEPSSYTMSKPGDPQACVSKRSMTFMPDVGVVYASPDGMMVCGGSAGQVTNATAKIFTKRQWQALQPSSILSAVHDGTLFFFATGPAPDGGFALDTKTGAGLIRFSFHATAAHVDPLTDALYLVLDVNSEPTDANLPLPSTAVAPSGVKVYQFDAGGSDMVFRWRGRLNLMPIPTALQCMQVRCASFENVLVRLYGDGVLLWEQVLDDMREFTIPTLDSHDDYELEFMGTSTVRAGQAAEETEELR